MKRPVFTIFSALLSTIVYAQKPEKSLSCCKDATEPQLQLLPLDATEKERWLRRIHEEADKDSSNIFLSDHYITDLRDQLKRQPLTAILTERFGIRWSLAQSLIRTGFLDEAIDLCNQCVKLCEQNPIEAKNWLPEVLFRLGATYFRQAEKQNCIAKHNAESCILPFSKQAVHIEKHGAAAAAVTLERLLSLPDNDLKMESIWLLNIAYMALGEWPEKVKPAYRIKESVFSGEEVFPRMIERGGEFGLSQHNHAGSIICDDFTGDGRIDILTCSFDTGRSLRLMKNEGDGKFSNISDLAGLSLQLGGINILQADIDNDGFKDLLVLRGGGFFAGSRFPNSLLRQDKLGHFLDITKTAGIEIDAPTRSASFADIDRDGDLDLFIGYETEPDEFGKKFPSKLFINNGNGVFTDSTGTSGIANTDRVIGAIFADFNGDDLPDLYLSNFIAPNRLYMNQGQCRFLEESTIRGLAGPLASGPCVSFDQDNDGDLDLFVTYQHHYRPIRAVAAFYIENRIEDDHQRFFENDGNGFFIDSTEKHGLKRVCVATGINVGDIDNDGNQDLYITTGAHDFAALFPNVLLRGGKKFSDVTFSAGVGHLQKANGVSFADIDGDGDLELAAQVGGFYQDDAFGNVLFENPGNANHWISIELRGLRDNYFGLGARIRAHLTQGNLESDVYTTMTTGGSSGCNPMCAHLGLGNADQIEFIEIHWPASGETQRIKNVDVDRLITIKQSENRSEIRSRPAKK